MENPHDQETLEIFYQEFEELLGQLEENILIMEDHPHHQESINQIFRAYHTIKGSAGAGGLTELSDYAHHVESLLFQIRDGQVLITTSLISVLLESLDCLNSFADAIQGKAPLDQKLLEQNLAKIQEFHTPLVSSAPTAPPSVTKDSDSPRPKETEPKNSFLIHLQFAPNTLESGIDPITTLRDLQTLGELIVIPHTIEIPPLEEIYATKLSLWWSLKLLTSKPLSDLETIFMFFADEHDIRVGTVETPPDETDKQAAINRTVESPPSQVEAPKPKTPQAKPPPDAESEKPVVTSPKVSSENSIRVPISKLDKLVNLVGETVINQSQFYQLYEAIAALDESLGERMLQTLDNSEMNVSELQEQVMNVRTVPIRATFAQFHRMIRDYTVHSDKHISLEVYGADTELDKTIIEQLNGLLTHLVRNAMDHGIETPAARRAVGKDPKGTITLQAYHEEGLVMIEVMDDGAGIDPEQLLAVAKKKGVVQEHDQLSENEILHLMFQPGFSTAKMVTDVSGRGVGMDVVKRDIEALQGTLEIKSKIGHGTTFLLKLPLTLAIIEGLMVEVGQEVYTIPVLPIIETFQPKEEQIKTVKRRGELINIRGEYLPLYRLYRLFNLEPKTEDPAQSLGVVVQHLGKKYCFLVDDVLDQQQFVIKSLEKNFVPLEGIAGATILSSGKVSLILDVPGLVRQSA